MGNDAIRDRRVICAAPTAARVAALLLLLALTPAAGAAGRPAPAREKIDASLLEHSGPDEAKREFLVLLREQAKGAELRELRRRAPHSTRGSAVVSRLRSQAASSQTGLLERIRSAGAEHRSFWAANMIWVRGDAALMHELATDADVARIMANPSVRFTPPLVSKSAGLAAAGIEPNLQLVGAPEVWELGIRGEGVVIAGADTGYQWDHPALVDQYRGWNGSSADHAYNWHDAVHTGGGSCGADSPFPCDDNNHGSHTMGIMLGDDGGANQIGMAPGARWIGCRNMNQGSGSPASYTECFEWFMAPTDADGLNPDPSKAPHIINNSWYCPASEGCIDPAILETVVANTRAAGILVVAAAANSGPACGSIDSPPAIYDASLTVAATDNNDVIASFSSRGPAPGGVAAPAKPEVSAPGVSIRSSLRGGGYGLISGTSMASPHVAGLAALLISAQPELAGDVEALEAAILSSTLPLTTNEGCGGDGPDDVPNNTYGHGRIDALAAVMSVSLPMPGLSSTGLALAVLALCASGRRTLRPGKG
jgi:serine protease AprX